MDIDQIKAAIEGVRDRLDALMLAAESGADWAEICRIEDEELIDLLKQYEEAKEENSQFGVGA